MLERSCLECPEFAWRTKNFIKMTTWYTSETFVMGTELQTLTADEAGSENRTNRKLKRLSVDSTDSNKRRSLTFEDTAPVDNKVDLIELCPQGGTINRLSRLYNDGKSRYPRMEDMPHFHYDCVDLNTRIQVCLHEPAANEGQEKRRYSETDDTGNTFLVSVKVTCQSKSWILRRTYENFIGLDKQIHTCLYDRQFSNLQVLSEFDQKNDHKKAKEALKTYLSRLSDISDDVINCGPVLNWFELDNHGNHLLLTDESAINVPAIAAGHVIKRYNAQSSDEISLEVGDIISVIDMPPVDESLWWRGKKTYEVGFFPSQCVEVIGDKTLRSHIPEASSKTHMKPVAKKRGKIISFLRSFLSSRPSRTHLIQSGILKERAFGGDLGEHLAQTGREVPLVLEKCCEMIEKHGIVDGVYRLSGMTSNIQKLRLAFDCDTPPDLSKDCYLHDIHCISSLLKMYFRELPNPLLTYHLYDKFVSAIQINDEDERRIAIHHVVEQLPPPHYRTLEYLLRHLAMVAAQSTETGMHSKNLAIVWAPNLLKAKGLESGGAALLEVRVQSIVVEYLIKNVHVFFDKDAASKAIVSKPQYSTAMRHRLQLAMEEFRAEEGLGMNPRLASISVSPPPKLLSLEEARRRVTSTPSRPPPPKPKLVEKYQSYPAKVITSKKEPPPVSPRRVSEGAANKKSFKAVFSKGKSFNATQKYSTTVSYYRSISNQEHRSQGLTETQTMEPYQSHRQRKEHEVHDRVQIRRVNQDIILRQEKGKYEKKEQRTSDECKIQKDPVVVPKEGTVTYASKVKNGRQSDSWQSRLNHMEVARSMQAQNKDSRAFRQTRSYTEINRTGNVEQTLQTSIPQSSSLHQVTRVHIKQVKHSPAGDSVKETSQIKFYVNNAEHQTNSDESDSHTENNTINSDSQTNVSAPSSSDSRIILNPGSSSSSNVISVPVKKPERKPRAYYRTFSEPSGTDEGSQKVSTPGSFTGRVTSAISIPVSVSNESPSKVNHAPPSRVLSRSNTVSSSGSGSGAMIRRHPVLHSFKRVSTDKPVYHSKGKPDQDWDETQEPKPKGVHRRASIGCHESDMKKSTISQSADFRPMSAYDNRPSSIYDNEPSTLYYSSPLLCPFNRVSEKHHGAQPASPESVSNTSQPLRWVQSALYRTETV